MVAYVVLPVVAVCICINIYFFYIGVCFYNLFKKPRTRMKAYINIVFRVVCVCVMRVQIEYGSVWMVYYVCSQ